MINISQFKTIYTYEVKGLTEEQHLFDDIPHEYRVVEWKKDVSRLRVLGRYGDRWYYNPNTRVLLAHLLHEKKLSNLCRFRADYWHMWE